MSAGAFDSVDRERLAANLAAVQERITRACQAAGRDPAEVSLVAVTKYTGPAYARALVELGQRDLGENRVEHLATLAGALRGLEPGPRWHFVGHLQRNKAKRVADTIDVLHSLDNLALARKLVERRDPARPPLEVYLQLRLDEAEVRSGVASPEELLGLAGDLVGLDRVRVLGLMGLPPMGEPEQARPHFRRLVAARDALQAAGVDAPLLSMGMTADLEVAVAEGATCVRVGRALLDGLSEDAQRA
jgi:PLP dependent protein